MIDLSGIARGIFPAGGNSMNATGMITEKSHDQLALPGSPSEATSDIPAHNTPDLTMSASQSYHNKVAAAPAGHPALAWTDVHHAGDDDTPNFGYPDR